MNQPGGGYLRWGHTSFTFSGGRTYRNVGARYLAKTDGGTEQVYSMGWEPSDVDRTAHFNVFISDGGSYAAKIWAFRQDTDWSIGLLAIHQQVTLPSWATVGARTFTWAQDAGGNPYVSRAETWLDPGTLNEKMSAVEQTLDARENVTQVKKYDYGAGSTPTRTYDATYVTNTNYTNQEKSRIFCEQVDAMLGAARAFKNDTVQYHPVGILGIGGPNSNSAAHYFGAYVGGDPVNFNDSPGLFSVSVAGQTWEGTDAGACKQWATQLRSPDLAL